MNKASRIESTGMAGRVHLSQETAQLLIARGKKHWVTEREDKVKMKGLTEQTTYWLNAKGEGSSGSGDGSQSSWGYTNSHRSSSTKSLLTDAENNMKQMRPRLVEWNAKVLSLTLQKIVALRTLDEVGANVDEERLREIESEAEFGKFTAPAGDITFQTVPKDFSFHSELPELGSDLSTQLQSFVHEVANACSINFFHNFEHASHMVLSVTKSLRFMDPSAYTGNNDDKLFTYLNDPLTHFVLLLAALIRDLKHPGINNEELKKEGNPLNLKYNGSNTIERNALDAAWDILKQDEYVDLRRAIYHTEQEFELFRELLVRSVLATDVSDKELQNQTVERWEEAFGKPDGNHEAPLNENQRKTALVEHIMQVTTNVHAMQHWHIYHRWSGALFNENAKAYEDLRIDQSPTEFWFKQELDYFDSYVLPLARRLKGSLVFEAMGEELAEHAWSNRCEWEEKGEGTIGS